MGAFFNQQDQDASYDKLWKEVLSFEKKALPKSAYEIVEKIYNKALGESNEAQLIKSIIYKSKLSASFEDREPADVLSQFESELKILPNKNAKAVMHSILGEMYHSYGITNSYRFDNRTTGSGSDLPFSSLDEIQKLSLDHYNSSLDLAGQEELSPYTAIMLEEQTGEWPVHCNTIYEFVVVRAINHFSNSSAFVTMPKGKYVLNQKELFGSEAEFRSLDINSPDADYRSQTLKLYQELSANSKLSKSLKNWLYIQRLDYVRSNFEAKNGDELYLEALKENTELEEVSALVFAKLADYYLQKGEDRATWESDENHFMEAYRWIDKYSKAYSDSVNLTRIQKLRSRLLKKSFRIETEQVVGSDDDFLIYVNYRNVRNMGFRLYKLNESQLSKWRNSRNREDKLNILKEIKVVDSWTSELPDSDDYRYHGIELPHSGLTFGNYVLLSKEGKIWDDKSNTQLNLNLFYVSDLSYSLLDRSNSNQGLVLHRISGEPVSDALVVQYSRNYNAQSRKNEWHEIARKQTDKNGRFKFANSTNHHFTYVVSKEEDKLDLREGHYHYGERHNNYTGTAHFYTDRSIYRPGQFVELKALLLRSFNEDRVPSLVTNKPIRVFFRDANGQVIDEKELKSNEFGSVACSFKIPDDVLTGMFTISTSQSDIVGRTSIRVEEYKRPKIKASFEKMTDKVIAGDSVNVNLRLESYSGLNLAGATVSYKVVKEKFYWPYYRFGRILPSPHGQNEIIETGTVVTDQQGLARIAFKSQSEEVESWSRYSISCDVTDATGESVEASKTISLSSFPFMEKIQMPESIIETDSSKLRIDVVNADDVPVKAEILIQAFPASGPQLHYKEKYWSFVDKHSISESKYEKRFPFELWEEHEVKITTKTPVAQETLNGSSVVSDVLSKLKMGKYKLLITIKDESGTSKSIEKIVSVSDMKHLAVPGQAIYLKPLSKQYQPGEEIELEINTPFKKFSVFYNVSHNGKLIESGEIDKRGKCIKFKLTEEMRGGIGINLILVKNNRVYSHTEYVNIPWSNKMLDLKIEHFEDKSTTGQEHNWTVTVLKDGKPYEEKLELLAAMYDKSLDAFVSHEWNKAFYPSYSRVLSSYAIGFRTSENLDYFNVRDNYYFSLNPEFYPRLNWFGYYPFNQGVWREYDHGGGRVMMSKRSMGAPEADMSVMESAVELDDQSILEVPEEEALAESTSNDSGDLIVRENFNETGFFYPHLTQNEDGELKINFTTGDALTEWRVMLMAHSDDLEYAYKEYVLKTSRPLMIEGFVPRFFRQGDDITLTSRVSNVESNNSLATARMRIVNAINGVDVTNEFLSSESVMQSIELVKGDTEILYWNLKVPDDIVSPVEIYFSVDSGNFTDAEKLVIPVLSNRVFVTESLPLFSNTKEEKAYQFDVLRKLENESLKHELLQLEYNADAASMILKALPVMMNDNLETSTGIFDALYATALGADLLSSNEAYKRLVMDWNREAADSPLFEKQSLKELNTELTPWLKSAQEESNNIQSLVKLLDKNEVSYKIDSYVRKLKQRQLSNGGFSWMPGGRDNQYITQYILEGLARLRNMGVDINALFSENDLRRALDYLDDRTWEYFEKSDKDVKWINANLVHYLYVRTSWSDYKFGDKAEKLLDFYLEHYQELWPETSSYIQAMLGIVYKMRSNEAVSNDIIKSLKQRMVVDQELGNYWNDQAGYYWYQLNVEKQATLIEFFTMMGEDNKLIDNLRLWLLKTKHVNSWPTTKATASAVYAFYNSGSTYQQASSDDLTIKVVGINREFKPDDKGLIEENWSNAEDVKNIKSFVINNKSDKTGWGAVHWQYFDDIDNVEAYNSAPVKLRKKVYIRVESDSGSQLHAIEPGSKLHPGDRLVVQIELVADRPMEFVLLKDMRASGTEPLNVLSQYKWQDGLSYYESTRDAASYFYIDFMPKGNFVFEYDVFVTHKGSFETGLASLQSYYAPEFNSHSASTSINVEAAK